MSGMGFLFSLIDTSIINPFTLLLHLVWSISVSAWVANIRTKLPHEKRALLAVGVAVAAGSGWSSIQQWLAYLEYGTVNDIALIAGAMALDAIGGTTTYVLYHLNILKK